MIIKINNFIVENIEIEKNKFYKINVIDENNIEKFSLFVSYYKYDNCFKMNRVMGRLNIDKKQFYEIIETIRPSFSILKHGEITNYDFTKTYLLDEIMIVDDLPIKTSCIIS